MSGSIKSVDSNLFLMNLCFFECPSPEQPLTLRSHVKSIQLKTVDYKKLRTDNLIYVQTLQP